MEEETMKKSTRLLALALLAALALTACGKDSAQETPDTQIDVSTQPQAEGENLAVSESTAPESPEETTAPAEASSEAATPGPLAGYVYYENSSDGLRFQYPESWLMPTEAQNLTEEDLASLEELGIDPELFSMSMEMTSAYIYDLENADEKFMPNLNYNVQSASGLTQSALTTDVMMSQLGSSFESEYQAYFNDFAWATSPEKRSFGANDFVYFVSSYTLDGETIHANQAMTVNDGQLFTFTYTTVAGRDASVFQSVLETVEWM